MRQTSDDRRLSSRLSSRAMALNPSAASFVVERPRGGGGVGRATTTLAEEGEEAHGGRARALANAFDSLGLVREDEDGDGDGDGGVGFDEPHSWVSSHADHAVVAPVVGDGGFDESLAFLCESFPDVDAACLEEALMNTGGDVELAIELLMDEDVPEIEAPVLDDVEAFPSLGGGRGSARVDVEREDEDALPKKIFLSGGMSNVNKASAASLWKASTSASTSSTLMTKNMRSEAPSEGTKIEWVETGAAVSQLYQTTRDEARDHARVRNVCYEQATNAFLAGNKALAKELSRQGREAAAKMSAAHADAAANIYAHRGGGRSGTIDLHGLHVTEALSILRRELPRLRDSGEPYAHVLVGTGHHTVGSRTPSRLPVAVETFLHQERWRFSEPQSGLLQVRLI